MGLNTYPSNPFPPSTDRMDADTLEAEVNELKSGLTNVTKSSGGSRVNIDSYTLSSGNGYVCGYDGYALISCGQSISGNIYVYGDNDSNLCVLTAVADTSNAVFVRKGMTLYVEAVAGAPQFRFVPII